MWEATYRHSCEDDQIAERTLGMERHPVMDPGTLAPCGVCGKQWTLAKYRRTGGYEENKRKVRRRPGGFKVEQLNLW